MKYSLICVINLIIICEHIYWAESRHLLRADIATKPGDKWWEKVPGPFNAWHFNLILYALLAFISILLILLLCCVCCCLCCRKAPEDLLVVTPSELIGIGATPSDLKAANITPSLLKDAGADYEQMAQLGATPSQLVEAGADKHDLDKLGATQSQLSHVGYHQDKPKPKSTKPVSPEKQNKTSIIPQKDEKSTLPKDNAVSNTGVSEKSAKPKKLSKMSEQIKSLAEKVKDKPKTKGKGKTEAPVADDTISTVSTSPKKKAAALKPTDDSFSVAMGPTDNK